MGKVLPKFHLYLGPGAVFKGKITRHTLDVHPRSPSNLSRSEEECLDNFVKSLMWGISDLQYTEFPKKGTIIGSKSSFIKHVSRLVEYWLNGYADRHLGIAFRKHGMLQDPTGNMVKLDGLRFNDFRFHTRGRWYRVDGNLPITIAPVLESYLYASKFKRFLAKYFPKLVETRRNVFKTVWSMHFRVWISSDTYYDWEIIKFDALGRILVPSEISEEKRKSIQNEHRNKLSRVLGHEGGIRISEVGKA